VVAATLRRWHVLARLAREFGLREFAEIGIRHGAMTNALLALLPDAHLICVDPWAPCGSYYNWSALYHRQNEMKFDAVAKKYPGRIRKLKMTSEQAASVVADQSLDCVFIDGDHTYDMVAADIRLWLPKVRKGGVISGHDYNNRFRRDFRGLDRAVNEAFQSVNAEADHVWWKTV
jgi:methyltransferase family protein